MKRRSIAFIHASPAAIAPLMHYYGQKAPELEVTNLLDDGLLRLFRAADHDRIGKRLHSLLSAARETYCAEAVMITCSAVTKTLMAELRDSVDVPLFKIDEPMARAAVRSGGRIAVVVTFPPTLEQTTNLLREAASEGGFAVELEPHVIPAAYDALLGGDSEKHDALLLEEIDRMSGVSGIVLAQVSMARLLPSLERRVRIPVYSSLPVSLSTVRHLLAGTSGGRAGQ